MELRVLHIIDSLSPGGAERMAVNLANGLAEQGVKTFLCATRKEGIYREQINNKVEYIFLGRNTFFDIKAFLKLKAFVEKNNITHLHSHSTSIFFGWLLKLFSNRRLIFHDHYGLKDATFLRNISLRVFLRRVDFVCSVNDNLRNFIIKNMRIDPSKAAVLNNFPDLDTKQDVIEKPLPGPEGKRFICLANLRPQKDHINLIKAFDLLSQEMPCWHLLLVGSGYDDDYFIKIQKIIKGGSLEGRVHVLGARNDVAGILRHSTIGILSSVSEGLPVALLEYGLFRLPVVCTDVGQCREVLGGGEFGRIVPPEDHQALSKAMMALAFDAEECKSLGEKFYGQVLNNYSKERAISHLIEIYKAL